jgi:uncharacterized protein (DUF2249 family)
MTDTTRTTPPTDPATGDGAVGTASAPAGGCGCGGCGCGAAHVAPDGAPTSRREGLQIVPGPAPAGDGAVEPGDLDLRPLARAERHARAVAAVGGLLPGEGLVVAVDHDPVGLRRQLEEQDLGHLGWQYLAQGPDVWRVLVSRDTCC